MTWKEFLTSLPERQVIHQYGDLDPDINLKTLSWGEKNRHLKDYSYDFVIRCDNGIFFIGLQRTSLKRVGKNIFKTSEWQSYIRIEGTKTQRYAIDHLQVRQFLETLGIKWCKDLSDKEFFFMGRPSIFKKVLVGKIYSQETLWKTVAASCFHAKSFPWRLIKEYLSYNSYDLPDFNDVLLFTKTPTVSVQKILDAAKAGNSSKMYLIRDLVNSAILLDQPVDLSWSTKRMETEHKEQIQKLMDLESGDLSEDEIQKARVEEKGIRMLNTEKEIYIEGRTMSHCLFTNYRNDIKNKELLAFHMSEPEDCTFSVELNYKQAPVLQQIHLSHNRMVQNDTRALALDFISRNMEQMTSMLARSHKGEDLPF